MRALARDYGSILFTVAILAVVGMAVWDARNWEIKARLFPWVIGIPVLAMLAGQLVLQFMERARAGAPLPAHPAQLTPEQALARRRFFTIVGWMLGFAVAIWLVGFPIGGTLMTLAYLKLQGRERWRISLAITAGIAVFFFIMVKLLYIPFPEGYLVKLLGF